MKYLLCAFLVVCPAACSHFNQMAANRWTDDDKRIMADLTAYRKAQGKPTDDITAHLAKDLRSIPADEETALMAEILADIAADPKRIQEEKDSYPGRVQAHLNDFNSLKGH